MKYSRVWRQAGRHNPWAGQGGLGQHGGHRGGVLHAKNDHVSDTAAEYSMMQPASYLVQHHTQAVNSNTIQASVDMHTLPVSV